jgi:NACalpha-BTF3-like transcription factor
MAITPEQRAIVLQDLRNIANILMKFDSKEVDIKCTQAQLTNLQTELKDYQSKTDPLSFIFDKVKMKFNVGAVEDPEEDPEC